MSVCEGEARLVVRERKSRVDIYVGKAVRGWIWHATSPTQVEGGSTKTWAEGYRKAMRAADRLMRAPKKGRKRA